MTHRIDVKHMIVVRGFEVELYAKRRNRSPKLVDIGVWRKFGYVHWKAEKKFPDFFVLDRVDQVLRAHYPAGTGTVNRAQSPSFIPAISFKP